MDTRELLARLLDEAIVLPRTEIARALVEPQKAIINVITARVADLRILDAFVERELHHPSFGMF